MSTFAKVMRCLYSYHIRAGYPAKGIAREEGMVAPLAGMKGGQQDSLPLRKSLPSSIGTASNLWQPYFIPRQSNTALANACFHHREKRHCVYPVVPSKGKGEVRHFCAFWHGT